MLHPAFHLLRPVLDELTCGGLQRGSFLPCWAYGLFDTIIHPLNVACISDWPYLRAEVKPVVIFISPSGLLDFAVCSSEDLLVFAGTGFSSCQGSPLLINYWCHLLGADSNQSTVLLVFLQKMDNKAALWTAFLSIACVSMGQAWKKFIKCTCKFLHFTLF